MDSSTGGIGLLDNVMSALNMTAEPSKAILAHEPACFAERQMIESIVQEVGEERALDILSRGAAVLYQATHPFEGTEEQQLKFDKSAVLEIDTQLKNGWWHALDDEGKVGWVPSAYLKPLSTVAAAHVATLPERPGHDSGTEAAGNSAALEDVTSSPKSKPSSEAVKASSATSLHIVKHDYTATQEGQINLRKGATVHVVTKRDNGWWYGSVLTAASDNNGDPDWKKTTSVDAADGSTPTTQGESGWMPASYLRLVESGSAAASRKTSRDIAEGRSRRASAGDILSVPKAATATDRSRRASADLLVSSSRESNGFPTRKMSLDTLNDPRKGSDASTVSRASSEAVERESGLASALTTSRRASVDLILARRASAAPPPATRPRSIEAVVVAEGAASAIVSGHEMLAEFVGVVASRKASVDLMRDLAPGREEGEKDCQAKVLDQDKAGQATEEARSLAISMNEETAPGSQTQDTAAASVLPDLGVEQAGRLRHLTMDRPKRPNVRKPTRVSNNDGEISPTTGPLATQGPPADAPERRDTTEDGELERSVREEVEARIRAEVEAQVRAEMASYDATVGPTNPTATAAAQSTEEDAKGGQQQEKEWSDAPFGEEEMSQYEAALDAMANAAKGPRKSPRELRRMLSQLEKPSTPPPPPEMSEDEQPETPSTPSSEAGQEPPKPTRPAPAPPAGEVVGPVTARKRKPIRRGKGVKEGAGIQRRRPGSVVELLKKLSNQEIDLEDHVVEETWWRFKTHTFTIAKEDDEGLGFGISGGAGMLDSRDRPMAIRIQKINPNGAAGRDGNLKVGDFIDAAGGISFDMITHDDAVQALKALRGMTEAVISVRRKVKKFKEEKTTDA